jgi:ABC-type Na+ efflux pump permease subunit
MGRNVLPVAAVLLVLLVAVTGFAAERGLHLQDGLYRAGVDDPAVADIIAGDPRFAVSTGSSGELYQDRGSYDVLIISREVNVQESDRGRAAGRALQRDYQWYLDSVYSREKDLFAAYPLWIDVQNVRSELDFSATQAGRQLTAAPGSPAPPVPEGPVEEVPAPPAGISISTDELRKGLAEAQGKNAQVARYTEVLGAESPFGSFRTPSQLSPPLPFDTIILVFLFIFPLYFTSQFYMMSIMQERLERRGEVLLSTPASPAAIVAGKALPYFAGMVAISAGIALWLKASLAVLLPLFPVILFFLASALIIGMVSRSFKELSFISIFFSTVATSYLFFPTIFANVHVISLVSPLTLVVLTLQGEAYTLDQYLFSTSLFFLTSAALFYAGIANFREERLFSFSGIAARVRDFVATSLSDRHPWASLFAVNAIAVPFVFMVQMMLLVLFFNLPMPLSLVLLLVSAAFVEEIAKSVGITTLLLETPRRFPWPAVAAGAAVTAAAFLFAEKFLLLVTLAQITESVFGSLLFLSLGALALPFLLHFTGVFVTGAFVKWQGLRGYVPGIIIAALVHCLYNAYFILGWLT